MITNRLIEYVFFFGFLGVVAYLVWQLVAPFINALALAAIIATICYPLYEQVKKRVPRQSGTFASLLTSLLVVIIVMVPLALLGLFIFREAAAVYRLFSTGSTFSVTASLEDVEAFIQGYVPEFSLNISTYLQQIAEFFASHTAAIFTGTASTLFMLFIALIATFYFFRDGRKFTKYLIEVSPLPDSEDTMILRRLARSIRSVAVGVVLVALIQGVMTAIGMAIFGFDRFVLWGSIAAFGALVPGVGTSVVFIPAVVYLVMTGAYFHAVGVAIWAALAVGLIDNLLGPYLISRGGALHPFLILLAVLGGIIFFGPIGFVLGPVILSLFKVLLELYAAHIAENAPHKKV